MTKRLTIQLSDEQYADLLEVATLDQSSIANVVRDCIRATLPQLVQVSRFIYDPRNSPTEVLEFADQMERALGLIAGDAKVGSADVATPPRRTYKRPEMPPSSNTGAHE